MIRRIARLAAGALVLLAAACSERLATPGDCPELCPGGQLEVFDTTFTATELLDSSFVGYVAKGQGSSLQLANGLDGARTHVFLQFLPRDETVQVQDTNRAYVIDSVAFVLGVFARDTAVKNLRLRLYKLPATFDTTTPFAELDAALVAAALIDSVTVPDTTEDGQRRVVLRGEQLARVALTEADARVLRVGVELAADGTTGARIGGVGGGSFTPLFVTYVTADVADTALRRQSITRGIDRGTWVSDQPAAVPGPGELLVGSAPSWRTLVRFAWSPKYRDSVTIVRARLDLVTVGPVPGLPSDTARLEARAIVADLGAKSPLLGGLTLQEAVPPGFDGTIEFDMGSLVSQWQGDNARPPAVFLALAPEGSSFTSFRLGASTDPARVPRLRIAYVRRFPFENP